MSKGMYITKYWPLKVTHLLSFPNVLRPSPFPSSPKSVHLWLQPWREFMLYNSCKKKWRFVYVCRNYAKYGYREWLIWSWFNVKSHHTSFIYPYQIISITYKRACMLLSTFHSKIHIRFHIHLERLDFNWHIFEYTESELNRNIHIRCNFYRSALLNLTLPYIPHNQLKPNITNT